MNARRWMTSAEALGGRVVTEQERFTPAEWAAMSRRSSDLMRVALYVTMADRTPVVMATQQAVAVAAEMGFQGPTEAPAGMTAPHPARYYFGYSIEPDAFWQCDENNTGEGDR